MVFTLVGAVALMFIIGIGAGGIRGGFGTNSSNPLTNSGTSLLNAVLIANSPQLAPSTVHVIYNNTFTRLVRSTYRSQLPYRYSIPLIIASAFLHWLMSNTIYVFISQGNYFQHLGGSEKDSTYSDSNLPPGSTVSVGYSIITLAILALGLLVGFMLPSIWSQKPLVGFGNSVGCNSFAMSASCHVPTLSRPDSESDISRKLEGRMDLDMPEAFNDSETELALLSPARNDLENHEEDARLKKIAQSRLRWGVVKMSLGWSSQYSGSYDQVGHISFGTTSDEVEEPVHDRWYV
ncbi:hypothetical protein INS49_008142 [Diaporthe citri]|uniref:uncharacterized protein n=1 Tax=Diaporthe citri TaxID=83186 RepID=UPI001C81D151|nr:uncharacterized protein INS49_008142 [Diaporthe citri]KAG6363047.1 hypothetical protein INS49_008142 [Diaporthe citri]